MKCDNCFIDKDIKDLVEIKKDDSIVRLCLTCYRRLKLQKNFKKNYYEKIENEILGFEICGDIIEVEFEEFYLEVELKDMQGIEINKKNLAKIIQKKYI